VIVQGFPEVIKVGEAARKAVNSVGKVIASSSSVTASERTMPKSSPPLNTSSTIRFVRWFDTSSDLDVEDIEDLEDAPEAEIEKAEEAVTDAATAAQTIAELEAEIHILCDLEKSAQSLRRSGTDSKWQKLADTLHDNPYMFDPSGNRRKLVVFTEQRDTLN
jgi:hypothetical protein